MLKVKMLKFFHATSAAHACVCVCFDILIIEKINFTDNMYAILSN